MSARWPVLLLRRYLLCANSGHVQLAAVPSRAEPDGGEISVSGIITALEKQGYAARLGLSTSRGGSPSRDWAGCGAFKRRGGGLLDKKSQMRAYEFPIAPELQKQARH